MIKKRLVLIAVFLVSICSYSQLIFNAPEVDSIWTWYPYDYSIYKTGSQYLEDYPDQEDTTIYAEFSWNKVPRWLAIRSGHVFSDADINTIANNHQMVMLEKYNSQGTGSTEKGTLAAAARIKAVNPDIKILFYWNTWINYYAYDANTEYEANKWEWSDLTLGVDGQDTLDMFKDLYYTYNYDSPGLRAWWVKTALSMLEDDLIDGVFIDKVHSHEGLYFTDGEPSTNYIRMLDSLSQLLPEGKIFFGNVLRNERWGGNRGHMNYADGSYWERWEFQYRYTDPRQTEADARCVNMQLAREAVLKGKIVNFMGGGETTAIPPTEAEENEANMRGFLREDVQFSLAVYLTIADTNAYFNFKESVDTDDEDWRWDASFLEELNRPLGKPLSDPLKNGYVYTRSYEKVDVWVNVETTEAKLMWKDYPDFLKLKLIVRDSSTNAVIPAATIVVENLNRITDAAGVLSFGLDSGSYSIRISKSGYVTKNEIYAFSSDTVLTIYLAPKPFDDGTKDEISAYYQVIKKNAPSYCLYAGDVELAKDGDQLTLYPYEEGDPNTIWVEYDRGDGYYSYQLLNTNYWIDGGDGGANSQGVFLSEWDDDSYDQYWQKEVSDMGYVRLEKRDVEFVINGGSGAITGQTISLWRSPSPSTNMHWMLHSVGEEPVSITISIVDTITEQGLFGVEINFNDDIKQTSIGGTVHFPGLDVPNTFTYTLSKEGYVGKEGSLILTKNDSIIIEMVPISSEIKEDVALGVKIYPNPATHFLMVEADKDMSKIAIFNIDGRLLFSEKASGLSHKLVLSDMNQSLLFVNVVLNDGGEVTKRIIVNSVGGH